MVRAQSEEWEDRRCLPFRFGSSVKTYSPFSSSHTKRFPLASINVCACKTRLVPRGICQVYLGSPILLGQ